MKSYINKFRGSALFAASNSGLGFKNYFDMIFGRERIERIYVIKGGPGTGKSRFMNEAAEYAESKGKSVEYYNCSSDPDSLDGIIIDGKTAIVDGTPPHAVEPLMPGAYEEIINLGEFWDGDALAQRFDEISKLNSKKSACFARAYRYLSACKNVLDAQRALILPCVKHEKMNRAATRTVAKIPRGKEYKAIPAITDSVGMKGRVKYDTFIKCAEKLCVIDDYYNTAHMFLSLVISEAQKNGNEIRVSFSPVDPDRPDAVYFCESGTAFVVAEDGEYAANSGGDAKVTRVNMKRFTEPSGISLAKGEFRFAEKLYRSLLDGACEAMSDASVYHYKLEEIYMSCMDFEAKERFTRSFVRKLL